MFLDTSVLVPVFYPAHIHHERSLALFTEQTSATGCCGVHSLAEVFANLTRMPGKQKASGVEAMFFIEDVRAKLSLVSLNVEEHLAALKRAVDLSTAGATVYDLLLTQCALKVNATTIYTWNLRHYGLCGEEVAARLHAP